MIVDIGRARGLGYQPTVTLDEGIASAWVDFGGEPAPSVPAAGIAGP